VAFLCRNRLQLQIAAFNQILRRPACPELRFQFPARSPTGWRLGRLDLWIQVQKEPKPVDFTNSGASIDWSLRKTCNLIFIKACGANINEAVMPETPLQSLL
jgi:hypothetical protein